MCIRVIRLMEIYVLSAAFVVHVCSAWIPRCGSVAYGNDSFYTETDKSFAKKMAFVQILIRSAGLHALITRPTAKLYYPSFVFSRIIIIIRKTDEVHLITNNNIIFSYFNREVTLIFLSETSRNWNDQFDQLRT